MLTDYLRAAMGKASYEMLEDNGGFAATIAQCPGVTAHIEIRHSNFLAWLLNPNESHGQGSVDTAMQRMKEELDRLYERYKDVPTQFNTRWNSRGKE